MLNSFLSWLNRVFGGSSSDVPHETIPPVTSGSTPWIDVARKELGVHEVRGGENPRIIEYHSATDLGAREDEVPWCASFVNWCLKQISYSRTNSAAAMSFATYGEKLDQPKVGCIVVFAWSGGGHHVTFCTDINSSEVKGLGGNQSDEVDEKWFPRKYAVAYRWPVKL